MFNNKKKVLCAIQIIDEKIEETKELESVFPHPTGFEMEESQSTNDSTAQHGEGSI